MRPNPNPSAKPRVGADGRLLAWTAETQALGQELASGLPLLGCAPGPGVQIEARLGRDSLWLLMRKPEGGALALRTAHAPGGGLTAQAAAAPDDALCAFSAFAAAAGFEVSVARAGERLLRVTTRITPTAPLLIPFWPRDLYPLGEGDDPTLAEGTVLAGQRGLNAAVCFLRMTEPAFGGALYFQNLTALNPWFRLTGVNPDSTVGGQWPELGYQPPAAPDAPSPPRKALPAGEAVTLSDAFLYLPESLPEGEVAEAEAFLEGLAAIYPHLEQPEPQFRDWPGLARRTLAGLSRSPKVTVERYGHRYVRPYTDAEVPDSMVQLAVTLPVRQYARWRGAPSPLAEALRAGVGKFFDAELGTIRRYLPNVALGREPLAKDKDANEVDSWYLYHPLANLGRMALDGDEQARDLFFGSMDYAIKVARHFDYQWPVLFDVATLAVRREQRQPDQPGQSDVGGLYAYVMLQAHALSGEQRYLDEAVRAVEALRSLKFQLLYQTNITAWGVAACLKLWRLTGDPAIHDQVKVLLAGFFHNSLFWESDIERAQHYHTFLGATCLHDGPYMALYECWESCIAFWEYLEEAGDDVPPPIRLLLNEYCRHTLSRAWFYYPAHLPEDLPSTENRNGHIDRRLAMPMEDLYADGRAPGEVGQEIYGCGAAFMFTARAFHRRRGAPFTLFCDYPLRDHKVEAGQWSARIDGWEGGRCRLRILPRSTADLKRLKVRIDGEAVPGRRVEGAWEAQVPGRGEVTVRWS